MASTTKTTRIGVLGCVLLGAVAWLATVEQARGQGSGRPEDSPEYWKKDYKRMGALGKGFVLWESNRTGAYRIWYRNLDGTGLRQVSPDEKGKWHYAAHVSPDGKKLVYLSYPPNRWRDGWVATPRGRKIPMHLINVDGTGDRVIVDNARTYQEHRAAIWHSDDEVVYIDAKGFTRKMNVKTGKSVALTSVGQKEFGWLLNRTMTHGTGSTIWITFSTFDRETRTVVKTKVYGGCQPYFSDDGVWGIYVGGSGGPLNRVLLATGKATPILKKPDPRMPPSRKYYYFPMISASQRLFAFGAAPKRTWDRDPRADFDIFVAHCKPRTLELIGRPVRYTFTKGQDRFPSVYLPSKGKRPAAPEADPRRPGPSQQSAWPTYRARLMFLWQTSDHSNLVQDPRTRKPRAYGLRMRGQVWLDHNYALHMVGKGSALAEEAGPSIVNASRRKAFSVEATIVPAAGWDGKSGQSPFARIITLCDEKDPNKVYFSLAQQANRLVFSLRSTVDGKEVETGWRYLGQVSLGAVAHVAVTYDSGAIAGYLDGKNVFEVKVPRTPRGAKRIKRDLSNWLSGRLLLGGLDKARDAWSGALEGVAVYSRRLLPAEVRVNRRRYLKIMSARKPVAKLKVTATLVAKTKTPAVKDLAAYRDALVVYEYKLAKVLSGGPAPRRFRVANWAILDRVPLDLDKRKIGATYPLVLEEWDANPQLKPYMFVDDLEEDLDVPRYFEPGR